MPKPILYLVEFSPLVRACRVTAAAIGVELDARPLDVFNGEQLQDWFKKINPQHTIPTLVDEGEGIWDSHVICTYLISKYATDDSLYPKDLLPRARVDQRLHFNNSVLFIALRTASLAIVRDGASVLPQSALDTIASAYEHVENFLKLTKHIAGDSLTVADFCCGALISSLDYHLPLTVDKQPKTLAWLERLNEIPHFKELNTKVNDTKFRAFFDQKKAANKAAE